MADQAVLDRVQKLLAHAQSTNAEESEEARTAAIQVTRMMKEHKLVLVPLDEIERVKKVIGDAQALAKQHESESTQKMLIGAVAGVLLGPMLGGKGFKL